MLNPPHPPDEERDRVVDLPALHKQKKPSPLLGEPTQNPAETL